MLANRKQRGQRSSEARSVLEPDRPADLEQTGQKHT